MAEKLNELLEPEGFDRAIEMLENAVEIDPEFLWQLISVPQLQLDPQWDALRENPRFNQLLEIN